MKILPFVVAFFLLLIPAMANPHGDLTACTSNLKNIGSALEDYAKGHGGAYPASLNQLVPSILRELPNCSANGQRYSYRKVGANSYHVACPDGHTSLGLKRGEPFYTGIQGLGPSDKLAAIRDQAFQASNPPSDVCGRNMAKIGTAMEMYHADFKKYPTSVTLLLEKGLYLKAMPVCPVAKRDTYSSSLKSTSSEFRLHCSGAHHTKEGLRANYPAYDSNKGVIKN